MSIDKQNLKAVEGKLRSLEYAIQVEDINGVTPIPMLCSSVESVNAAPVPLNRSAKVVNRSGKTVATKAADALAFTWV